jgi:hypothetical protein
MRDNLKWKLGLRLTQDIDVSKLGIRFINLGKNKIGNAGAIQMANAIKQDAYMRGISFRHNQIGEAGMLELIHATHCNKNLLLMDIRENHTCYILKKLNERVKEELLFNLKKLIESYVDRAGAVEKQKAQQAVAISPNRNQLSPKAQKKLEPVVYKQSRINYDWISPSLFGCEVRGDNDGSPNRKN